jgi:hypothetical protein
MAEEIACGTCAEILCRYLQAAAYKNLNGYGRLLIVLSTKLY